jgi:hypothetical protein
MIGCAVPLTACSGSGSATSASTLPAGIDGTYRASVTVSEVVSAGVTEGAANDNSGTLTLTLAAGRITLDNKGHPPVCTGSYRTVEHRFVLT